MKQKNKVKRLKARIYAFENAKFTPGHGPIASSYNKPGSMQK